MQALDEQATQGSTGTTTQEDLRTRAEDYARREPMQAVGTAALFGLLLSILPITRILFGSLRLLFSLARPVLLIIGAITAIREVQGRD